MKGHRWVGDGCACLLLIALCLGVGLPRYLDGMHVTDEGFLAYGAIRVLDGDLPGHDFASLQPPLSFYSVAMLFELLGTSLASMRVLGLLLHLLVVLLVYAVGRQIAGRVPALLVALPAAGAGLPYFLFVPFAVWQGVVLSMLAVLLVLRAAASGSARLGGLAGIVTGLALVTRHDQGVSVAISVLICGLLLRGGDTGALRRPFAAWAAGAGVVLIPLALTWLAAGALPAMIDQLVIFPLATYTRTSAIPMPRFESGQDLGVRLLVACFYLPFLLQLSSMAWLAVKRARGPFGAREWVLAFLLLFSALFYLQVLTRSDLHHLLVALPPSFALGAWWMEGAMNRVSRVLAARREEALESRARRLGAALVVIAALSLGTWVAVLLRPHLIPSFAEPMAEVSLSRGGVRLPAPRARALTQMVRSIAEQVPPDRSILCLPYQPMFYFLSERRNPTSWNYLWPGDQSASDHRRLVAQARSDPPALVLLSGGEELERWAPTITAYVDADFELEARRGAIGIYRPR